MNLYATSGMSPPPMPHDLVITPRNPNHGNPWVTLFVILVIINIIRKVGRR